jgi:hypothetical protein
MIVYTHTKKIKVPLLLFLLTFIVAGYFSRIGVDPHHDGIMLKPAFDVARGSMLFRDTFTQYGALATLLQAGALLLFGKYLVTIQLLTAFFYGLIAALLYVIYRRIIPAFLSALSVLLWIFMAPYFLALFIPWASVYALFFQLLGTYFIIKYEERANAWYLFWTGVLTSAIFFTRQPGGVFMLAAVYAYLFCTFITKNHPLRKFIHALYLYTCGVALTTSCFLIWITANGAFRDFWLQSIQFAYNFGANRPTATLYGVISELFPSDKSMGFKSIGLLWSVFPIVTILVGVASLITLMWKRNIKQAKTVLIIAAIGLSAWNQYYPLNDERHIYWGGTQMFGLLTFTLYTVSGYVLSFVPRHRRKLTIVLTCIALAYCFGPYITLRINDAVEKLRTPYVTVSSPDILRGMLMPAGDAQFYSFAASIITTYFQNNPHGNVVNLSRDALYGAFDPRIRNVSPLTVNWWELYGIYPDFYAHIESYIQANKPLVVTYTQNIPYGYCPFSTSTSINPIVLSLPCK